MKNRSKLNLNHSSFYGFYPSEIFDFGPEAQKIKRIEYDNRSIEELQELKTLYTRAISPSLSKKDIIRKCEYAKRLLNLSIEDIDSFSSNSQQTASELTALLSLFVSAMAVAISIYGVMMFILPFLALVVIGTCLVYCKAVNLRSYNSKIKEYYRKMMMCFETLEDAINDNN